MHELKSPVTGDEWEKYHGIRRVSLFEERGRGEVYNDKHPDDKKEGNYPFVFLHDGKIIGSIRIDILNRRDAATRLVSIKKSERGKGHGTEMLRQAEAFIKEKDRTRVVVNAAPEAVEFYRRKGYSEEIWDAEELKQPGAQDCIQMTKKI
ncbi:MAG TPA: hypothetical protein DEA55_11830 [Rhodospirillaceae bacterium]|nr:hypothetical protein [Rhodospirillaceae bacterium]